MRVSEDIRPHLERLGLQELPDHETLTRAFRKRVKEVHPDRNRSQSEWASRETRELMLSLRAVRARLVADTRQTASSAGEMPPAKPARTHRAAPNPEKIGRRRIPQSRRLFQLLESPAGKFALPVDLIERVIGGDDCSLHFQDDGPVVVYADASYHAFLATGREYPGATARQGYVVLLRSGSAIVFPANTSFTGIEDVEVPEIVKSTAQDFIFLRGNVYSFPAHLADKAYSRATG